MKKIYNAPVMEVEMIESSDVITESGIIPKLTMEGVLSGASTTIQTQIAQQEAIDNGASMFSSLNM